MKEFIIAFVIALFATAWAFDTGAPPQRAGIGIGDVESTSECDSRARDEVYGDFLYSDSKGKTRARTAVTDSGQRNDTYFPIRGTAF
jgi:hypothetical protein